MPWERLVAMWCRGGTGGAAGGEGTLPGVGANAGGAGAEPAGLPGGTDVVACRRGEVAGAGAGDDGVATHAHAQERMRDVPLRIEDRRGGWRPSTRCKGHSGSSPSVLW